jgi:plastocyanin
MQVTNPAAVLLAGALLAGCTSDQPAIESPASPPATATTPAPAATGDAIELEAEDFAFETDQLSVAAGAHVSIEFKNRDEGIPHNFAVYESAGGAAVFQGEIVTGKTDTTYEFDAPAEPGSYPFQCDVHPGQMSGTLQVA